MQSTYLTDFIISNNTQDQKRQLQEKQGQRQLLAATY